MKTNFLLVIAVCCFQITVAQKKKDIAYFSREITFKDSITLSLLDEYILKVPEKRVLRMCCAAIKGGFHYEIENVATFEAITGRDKPFFLFHYRGYYILIDNGMGILMHQNDRFPKYIAKKLRKYLQQGYTKKPTGKGIWSVSHLIHEPPVLRATYSKEGLKIEWDGL